MLIERGVFMFFNAFISACFCCIRIVMISIALVTSGMHLEARLGNLCAVYPSIRTCIARKWINYLPELLRVYFLTIPGRQVTKFVRE